MTSESLWRQDKQYVFDGIPVGVFHYSRVPNVHVPDSHICIWTSDGVYATTRDGWAYVEPGVHQKIVHQQQVIDPETGRSPATS